MKTRDRARRASSVLMMSAVLAFGAAAALAEGGDDGERHHHPTLPVPSVLVFAGIAVGAAVIAARRRKSKNDAHAKRDSDI